MAKVPPPAAAKSKKGAPPPAQQTMGNLDKPEPGALAPLNFKVPEAFKKEFKIYATTHGMTMVGLLLEGFILVKEKRGK